MEFDFDKISGRNPVDREEESPYMRKWGRSGIYAITINNRVLYIGKSKAMNRRIHQHMNSSGEKKYYILREAIKAGYIVSFQVVEYCPVERLKEREAYYINYYMPPLNKQIPAHQDFEKRCSLIGSIGTYQDAIEKSKILSRVD